MIPDRPRLARTVHARLHVVDDEAKYVLTDLRTGRVMEIAPESWRALVHADGTRDLDALCLALAGDGLYRGQADLVQLLEELSAVGVLEDGLAAPAPEPPVARETTPLDRELEVLPDFTLVCDGRGSCCRFYGSVSFSPREAMKATLLADDLDLVIDSDHLFTPAMGAELDGTRAVAQVEGRCVFLHGARCGLHALGGPTAKPLPCRHYPAMLMDDGERVRVSLGPECACVFASLGRSDGEPLVPAYAKTLEDLGPVEPMRVPDPVPVSAMRTATRAELREWTLRFSRSLASARDCAALCAGLASAIEERGLDAAWQEPVISSTQDWLRALGARAKTGLETEQSWRAKSDLSRRVAAWIAHSLEDADAAALFEAPRIDAHEQFYLRALAHGCRLSLEGRTLVHGLRDRATRLLASRAMAARRIEPVEPSTEVPLALLEAAMRNLGLGSYADRL